jgi:uncharacterized repeat protein (TIGR01451 family)
MSAKMTFSEGAKTDPSRRCRRVVVGLLSCAAALAGTLAISVAAAFATVPGVGWEIHSLARPTNFQPGEAAEYTLSLFNVGTQASSGTITVTDTLPAGVTTAGTPAGFVNGIEFREDMWECTPGAGNSIVTCTSTFGASVAGLAAADPIVLPLSVEAGASGENRVEVSGGGAPECGGAGQGVCASTGNPTTLSSQRPSFAPINFTAAVVGADGALDTQAGGRPAALVTNLDFPNAYFVSQSTGRERELQPVETVKQVVIDLPAGLVGNPLAAPTCGLTELSSGGDCPAATKLGTLELIESAQSTPIESLPIYNVAPEPGYPASFGLVEPQTNTSATLFAGLRSGDYGVRVVSQNLPSFVINSGFTAIFYGDPAAQDMSPFMPLPLLTNSSDCTGEPLTVTAHVDSYQHPGRMLPNGEPDFSDPNWKAVTATLPPVTGCGALQFNPSLDVTPETSQAGAPAGYTVDLSIPQDEQPNGLGTPPLKRASVTLPEGVVLSPSAADGLVACSDAQFDQASTQPAGCSLASQIATVTAHTPILSETVTGQVFVGEPECSPCTAQDAQEGKLFRLFLQAQIPGATLKFVGTASTNPVTGQVTASFPGLVQQPIGDVQLQFKGGPRAPLANPRSCGTFTTTSELEPWSHQPAPGEAQGTPDGTPSSAFATTGCGSTSLFSPAFLAGAINNQAGGFSPLSVLISRTDQEQELSGVSVTTPPGLLGILKGVERCGEPQASQGACGAGSLIGHATALAGPGSHPFYVQGGQVYLTGPYKGAPFGLSIVVPAVAGPFNLGDVVVRSAIGVNPSTAQITVSSDPLPSVLDGVPLQIKDVNVSIDREGFTFNPTSCDPMGVTGILTSAQGASEGVSSRFQAAGCQGLAFKPSFKVSTAAKTSKASGASLTVRYTQTAGQANTHSVAVNLPKQLPARLTTIQQACTEGEFNQNPASCPVGSEIGTATASTPVLSSPVSGPVYLVSHGGAAFPDVVAILQGEGVTIDLTGSIDIKKGITSSTFASVPDAPISVFEMSLPEGPHSGLAANLPGKAKGDFCGQSLVMPTTITGQNGAVIKQTTKVAVSGCPKAKKTKKTKKAKGKHAGSKGKHAAKPGKSGKGGR